MQHECSYCWVVEYERSSDLPLPHRFYESRLEKVSQNYLVTEAKLEINLNQVKHIFHVAYGRNWSSINELLVKIIGGKGGYAFFFFKGKCHRSQVGLWQEHIQGLNKLLELHSTKHSQNELFQFLYRLTNHFKLWGHEPKLDFEIKF